MKFTQKRLSNDNYRTEQAVQVPLTSDVILTQFRL